MKYGVHQGSVLAPLYFSLYISPLGQIIWSNGIHFHCFTDDIQLYLKADDESQTHEIKDLLVHAEEMDFKKLPACEFR